MYNVDLFGKCATHKYGVSQGWWNNAPKSFRSLASEHCRVGGRTDPYVVGYGGK